MVAPQARTAGVTMLRALLDRPRLVLTTTSLLALAGALFWATMPREEDPRFPPRNAFIVTAFPGADAVTVERLVTDPIEEHLSEVEEVGWMDSSSRAGASVVYAKLDDAIYDTESAWDEVEDALTKAAAEFPQGVGEPFLDNDLVSQEAVVLAVVGSSDPLKLAAAAKRAKRDLLDLHPVQEVRLVGDPGEQVTVEYDQATAYRLGLGPRLLGGLLARRSQVIPGGWIRVGSKTANLEPQTDFSSLEEIRSTPIVLPSGTAVPLRLLARVRHGPREPAEERMYWQGELAVGLGVVPRENLDRIEFGKTVRRRLEEIRRELAPLRLEEVVFQPDQVESRLRGLLGSLRLGILIIFGVLLVAMGMRMGALVSLVLPLVTLASMALYGAFGGVLHQISIASLVIALGMLVDNAIVVVENVQWRLDRGMEIREAAASSARELAVPLGTATGTTLAAFVPMLLAKGETADFTRSIPVVIMLTLTVSYLFALTATPVLSRFLLRPRPPGRGDWGRRLAGPLARVAIRRPMGVLIATGVLLAATLVAAGGLKKRFFPIADRNVVLVDVRLPEGTHLGKTDEVARTIESALLAHPDVSSVATFLGRATPRFYYNLPSHPRSPHLAQILVQTHRLDAVGRVLEWTRDLALRELPEAEVVLRRLEQGPPIEAPIKLRLSGPDLDDLERSAELLMAELRKIPGTRDIRHNLGLGAPTMVFSIDDAAAGRHGLSRSDVAEVLLERTLGLPVGQYRAGEDPVPIVVRSPAGVELPVSGLEALQVTGPGGEEVSLGRIARFRIEWSPATIHHLWRDRYAKVMAQLEESVTASEVLERLKPRLPDLGLPAGVRLQLSGEAEESGKANTAILRAMPLGALLLLFFLLAEFNSFRRVGIILATVPLAAVGVVPGLLLSGQPFGFMSLLGMISLVGIVVNNAIVLLDVLESLRRKGRTLDTALEEAVRRRTRPILLTTGTTVAGLLPLAFSTSTLWPPLAWAMISGLVSSALLTLVVIPALYGVLFGNRAAP